MAASRVLADPRWLIGALPGALLVAGPRHEVEIELDASEEDLERIVELLAEGVTPAALADAAVSTEAEACELLRQLESLGALTGESHEVDPPGSPLASALLAALNADDRDGEAHYVWTAGELLVLPSGASGRELRRTLRAFVGGMESHARMAAYCALVRRGRRTVCGDRPEPSALEGAIDAVDGLDPALVHVVSLHGLGVESAPPGGADASGLHRLGPVVEAFKQGPVVDAAPELVLAMARTAHPNLRHPGTDHGWTAGLAPSWNQAELVARAEGAERFATGDAGGMEIVRSRAAELEGAVEPDSIYALGPRQRRDSQAALAYDPEVAYLWTPTTDGRWVAASQVFSPFADPAGPRLPGGGSSGVAAHATLEEAKRRALFELIERDAFLWTWVQGVSRERIDPDGLPPRTAARLRPAEQAGWRATFLNLTLDLKPVVLCALEEPDGVGVNVGLAAAGDPAAAAAKAALEALTALWTDPSALDGRIEAEEVSTPLDHVRFHHRPEARESRAFLLASTETIGLDEIAYREEPVERCVASVGEPLFVDLTSDLTQPFVVVRAFVPGLVPISFGFDREPLGVPRLSEPKLTADGRELGGTLRLDEAEPIMPHPFS